jgi:hypothetical protein
MEWIAQHEALAAWVQAVGSILAIIGAAWFTMIPVRAENRRREQARRDFVSLVTDVMQHALLSIEPMAAATALDVNNGLHGTLKTWDESGSAATIEELLDVPISSWPSALLYMRVYRLRSAMIQLREYIAQAAPTWHSSESHRSRGRDLTKVLRDREAEFRESLAGLQLRG